VPTQFKNVGLFHVRIMFNARPYALKFVEKKKNHFVLNKSGAIAEKCGRNRL